MQRYIVMLSGALALAACTACQVVSLQTQYAQEPPVQIAGLDLAGGADVRLDLAFRVPVRATILVSTAADMEARPVAVVTGEFDTTLSWVDAGAAAAPGVRYYRVQVQTGASAWKSTDEWAMFVQPREAGQRYLVSVPVALGAENRLDRLLGRQLGLGLHAGASTNDADRLELATGEGAWRAVYWMEGPDGVARWWNVEANAAAEDAIAPGQGFWIQRGAAAAKQGVRGAFWGRTYARPYGAVTIRLDEKRGTPFGLPASRPLQHRRADVAQRVAPSPLDPLGFAVVGSGGKTSDHRRADENGDQIWVWENNEWKGYYWLMDHVGAKWDGRWWDNKAADFADFALEPGAGYYYRHRANQWGGADFEWTPP